MAVSLNWVVLQKGVVEGSFIGLHGPQLTADRH